MKIVVISYSLTGNNEALAKSVAQEFSAEHMKITEPKRRTMISIVSDVIFSNRIPRVLPEPEILENYDLILFFGPVWMGHVATPIRAYLKHLKENPRKYAFISISGGANGPNPKLPDELKKRTGKEPAALINLFIADLLPRDPKPVPKVTMAYLLTERDVKSLSDTTVKVLQETVLNKQNI